MPLIRHRALLAAFMRRVLGVYQYRILLVARGEPLVLQRLQADAGLSTAVDTHRRGRTEDLVSAGLLRTAPGIGSNGLPSTQYAITPLGEEVADLVFDLLGPVAA